MLNVHHRLRRIGAVVGCAVLIGSGLGVVATSAGAEDPTTTTAPTTTAPGPICPATTANGKFVRYLYLNIMYRCPDAAGATYWEGLLDSGVPRATVADMLDMSPENLVDNNAVDLYQRVFHRAPTDNEIATAVASIKATHGDAFLLSSLYASPEFADNFETAADWLNAVYNAILERDADSAGGAYFGLMLGDSPTTAQRKQVAMLLEHSAENAAGWTAAALGAAFHRAPDTGGMDFWVGWLMGPGEFQTFRMWTYMLASDEGFALAQTQPNPES
jgi:hypothetical protein